MSGVNILGIDPGLGGGLAIISPSDGMMLEPMPTIGNELNIPALNKIIADHARDIRLAVLEKVGAMPGQGVSSMFKFGRVYGVAEALLVANGIPILDVRPQAWMKVMHEGVNSKLEPKQRSLLAFQRLFPFVDARRTAKCRNPDFGLVDAALMAEYGRRQAAIYNHTNVRSISGTQSDIHKMV